MGIRWVITLYLSTVFCTRLHDVYNARMADTYLATAIYVWPAAVGTLAPGQDLILL